MVVKFHNSRANRRGPGDKASNSQNVKIFFFSELTLADLTWLMGPRFYIKITFFRLKFECEQVFFPLKASSTFFIGLSQFNKIYFVDWMVCYLKSESDRAGFRQNLGKVKNSKMFISVPLLTTFDMWAKVFGLIPSLSSIGSSNKLRPRVNPIICS